jgi:hypothetical protein
VAQGKLNPIKKGPPAEADGPFESSSGICRLTELDYSETRVAVLRKHHAKWLFPQEKATSHTLCKGTFTLISL